MPCRSCCPPAGRPREWDLGTAFGLLTPHRKCAASIPAQRTHELRFRNDAFRLSIFVEDHSAFESCRAESQVTLPFGLGNLRHRCADRRRNGKCRLKYLSIGNYVFVFVFSVPMGVMWGP